MTCAAVIAPLKWLAIAVFTLALARPEARACKFPSGPPSLGARILPAEDATVGPLPLLSAVYYDDAVLTSASGQEIALSPASHIGATRTWRPSQPLPAGEYFWDFGGGRATRFFVDSELIAEPVPLVTEKAEVIAIIKDRESGCGDSCTSFDPSSLRIRFKSNAEDALAILSISDGTESSVSMGGSFGLDNELSFGASEFSDGALTTRSVCVWITLIAHDGTSGEPTELGCTHPETGDGIDDRTGCASSQTTDGLMWLLGLALIAWRRMTLEAAA